LYSLRNLNDSNINHRVLKTVLYKWQTFVSTFFFFFSTRLYGDIKESLLGLDEAVGSIHSTKKNKKGTGLV
jgi:hypothetical protein